MEKSRMVDATLAIHDGKHGKLCELCDLAEEVRRLREEKEADQWVAAETIVAMKAKLARVEVLLPQWRQDELDNAADDAAGPSRTGHSCAEEIEAALRDTQPSARRVAHERLAELVSTLQEELAEQQAYTGKIADRCAELSTKLARFEAAVRRISVSLGRDRPGNDPRFARVLLIAADELEKALSDPQPSAAPTKPQEPYNGW